jgi:glycerol uptake facilitator-like aquaporin
MTLARRVTAEGFGSAMLLAGVVGSGIMGDRLAGGNVAIALLANSTATGAVLVCLILALGPISGAHLNPAVTVCDASQGGLPWRDAAGYVAAQAIGALVGVVVAHIMFQEPLSFSRHARQGPAQVLSEFVATFGLLVVIWGTARLRSPAVVPFAVGAYVTAAFWFTASTSFANPAVTVARCFTDTFAGIRPGDVPGFVIAQMLGAASATGLFRWLVPSLPAVAPRVVGRGEEPTAHRGACRR